MSAPARADDYAATLPANRQPENRLTVNLVTGHFELAGPATPDELPFLDAIAQLRTLYPLAPEDIAWPAGQMHDANGRPLTIIEQERRA